MKSWSLQVTNCSCGENEHS